MTKHSVESSLFEGVFRKDLVSRFDSELRTSDGGASLLGVIDRRTNLNYARRVATVEAQVLPSSWVMFRCPAC